MTEKKAIIITSEEFEELVQKLTNYQCIPIFVYPNNEVGYLSMDESNFSDFDPENEDIGSILNDLADIEEEGNRGDAYWDEEVRRMLSEYMSMKVDEIIKIPRDEERIDILLLGE